MDGSKSNPLRINNISVLMRMLGLDAPSHPLMALIDYDTVKLDLSDAGTWLTLDFYKITFKKDFGGHVNYGAGTYDFNEGGMAFLEPGQVVQKPGDPNDYQGFALYFHPDLLSGYPLEQNIYRYGFFSYDVSEALFLSEKEKQTVGPIFQSINSELETNIDQFSNDVLVSQLEFLLNVSNRFYNRQFLTRKKNNDETIKKMNEWLQLHFENEDTNINRLPSPGDIATALQVSQRYLSDMLRSLTGKTTQQHIHLALINKAKHLLSTTKQTTAEIAYRLGFEHPQSFNKLFRQKTNVSPIEFRRTCDN